MARKELSAEQVAKYCCTSPDMIKDFYDATDTLDFAEEFADAEKIGNETPTLNPTPAPTNIATYEKCKIIPFPCKAVATDFYSKQ